MHICILSHSTFGNLEQCAARLDQALRAEGAEVTRRSIADVKAKAPPEADLYVFACPTRMGGPTWKMTRFVKRIRIEREHLKFAVLTTCGQSGAPTIEKLADLGVEAGLAHLPTNLEVKVHGIRGPLEEGWQTKVDAFAKELA